MAKERTIRASKYLQLDGVTDQTIALQGLLDQALTHGSITLLLDGMAAVTGLRLHSNTTLLCPDAGCGLFLLEDSDQPLPPKRSPNRKNRWEHRLMSSRRRR